MDEEKFFLGEKWSDSSFASVAVPEFVFVKQWAEQLLKVKEKKNDIRHQRIDGAQ